MLQSLRLFLIIPFFFALATSCGSKKSTTETVAEEKKSPVSNTDDLKMKKLGFVKATIKNFSQDEGCGFLIVLNETGQVLQTLNPLDISFQKEGLKIWVKYRPIRPIAPTCKKGILIDIEEIKRA